MNDLIMIWVPATLERYTRMVGMMLWRGALIWCNGLALGNRNGLILVFQGSGILTIECTFSYTDDAEKDTCHSPDRYIRVGLILDVIDELLILPI